MSMAIPRLASYSCQILAGEYVIISHNNSKYKAHISILGQQLLRKCEVIGACVTLEEDRRLAQLLVAGVYGQCVSVSTHNEIRLKVKRH